MKIQPVGDKILVKPMDAPISTALHVPDWYLNSEAYGEVVRLGTYNRTEKGFRHQNWPVAVNDRITFNNAPDVGLKVKDDEHGDCLLMHIGQVRCVIGAAE